MMGAELRPEGMGGEEPLGSKNTVHHLASSPDHMGIMPSAGYEKTSSDAASQTGSPPHL